MSIPNRASDAGPCSGRECRACGSSKWNIMAPCEVCEGACCDVCGESVGATAVVCVGCLPTYREAHDDLTWDAKRAPTIEQVEQVSAMVQYPNIPEWGTSRWIN